MPRKKKSSYSPRKGSRKKGGIRLFRQIGAFIRNVRSSRILKGMLLVGLWGFVALGVLMAFYAYEIPEILRKADLKRHPAIVMEDKDGTVFARYGDFHGDTISVSTLPPHLVKAFLAIEDRRFYDHGGVDVFGIMRASVRNFFAGRVVQGGSTITQQLAKNLFLSGTRTLRRKVQEVMLALWLERKLTKDEILSAYLNRIYLGSGTYGVDAAAWMYFNKSARNVNLHEATILAGLPRAPSRYSPLNDPKAAEGRARVVLQAMVDAKFITPNQKANAISSMPLPSDKPSVGMEGRYYADWIMEQLGGLIEEQEDDVIIRTTLDLSMQREAEKQVDAMLAQNGATKKVSQAALVTMNNAGAVRALVGGRNYNQSSFNRATQAKRQPGSSFKPFVYLAALEAGYSPDTSLTDAPLKIGSWRPQNYEDTYRGQISMRDALAFSVNTATIRLAQQVGISRVRQLAIKLGIHPPLQNDLSLALGTSEVSLLDLTSAYAVFANGGQAVAPYGISEIRSEKGQILYRRQAPPMPQLVNAGSVDALGDMLQAAVAYGTAKRAQLDVQVAGKTGTTQDYRDAWFVGYTSRLTTGVWMGNDDNDPMAKVTGGSLPAGLWHDYMIAARAGNDEPGRRESPASYSRQQSDGFQNFIEGIFGGGNNSGGDNNITIEHTYPGHKN
jgi:penicillin-binding protein 1A